MKLMLTVDRFEGGRREIAVLLTPDGRQIDFPRDLLPKDALAGDVLSFTLDRDEKATRNKQERTNRLQDELRLKDPGGDVKL